MSEFKIESGIPMPGKSGGSAAKYPWKEMNVGDSFFIPRILITSLATARYWAQDTTGFKFKGKTVFEGVKGVRIWRVA